MTREMPFSEERPWGEFRQFTAGESSTVKLIRVKAGERLSLQYHERRSEFWAVLFGQPEVTIGDQVVRANERDEFSIPAGARHRLAGGEAGALILEISFGDFDENDIVRLEDEYGRAHPDAENSDKTGD
jgi:mannose-6-phosphate isomerase-like protein (cupin superfamily)